MGNHRLWDFSKESCPKYISDLVLCELAVLVSYYLLLFRNLPGFTLSQSLLALLGLHLIMLPLLFALFSHCRSKLSAAASALFPCGIYTILSYRRTALVSMLGILVLFTLLGLTVSAVSFAITGRFLRRRGFKAGDRRSRAVTDSPLRRRRIGTEDRHGRTVTDSPRLRSGESSGTHGRRSDIDDSVTHRLVSEYPGTFSLLYRCLCRTVFFQAIGLAAILMTVVLSSHFGIFLLPPSEGVIAGTSSAAQEMSVTDSTNAVMKLQEDVWSTLADDEKLSTLQTIANIEARYFGLPCGIKVCADDLSSGVLGCYDDQEHLVSIDQEHLGNDPARDVLCTLCHECYHAYEYRLTEVYLSSGNRYQSLRCFGNAASYAEELADYTSGFQDYMEYYDQDCETDARNYAEEAVTDYYEIVSAHQSDT